MAGLFNLKNAIYDIRVTEKGGRLIATCQALAYRIGKPRGLVPNGTVTGEESYD
jgi:hypothetical protein